MKEPRRCQCIPATIEGGAHASICEGILSNAGRSAELRAELRAEREHVGSLYARLDAERGAAVAALDRVLRDSSATDPEARWHRDVTVRMLSAQVDRLSVAESGLCFGRIDGRDGERAYIGRVGLFDEDADYEPLLMDWRAPPAPPLFFATGATTKGPGRRRPFPT